VKNIEVEIRSFITKEKYEETPSLLKEKFSILDIPITSKEEFSQKYEGCKKDWRELIK